LATLDMESETFSQGPPGLVYEVRCWSRWSRIGLIYLVA
jgi:hypothetical protein